jgi:hypothetical protein
MRYSRQILIGAGVLAGSTLLGGLVVVGCSSSSTEVNGPSGMDASGDGANANGDSTTPMDAPPAEETGGGDGGVGPTDSGEKGDADAGQIVLPDGGPVLVDDAGVAGFPLQVATALCNRYAACCVPNLDGGAFDVQSCIANNLASGYAGGSSLGANLADGGHIVFDGLKAQSCLNQINAIDCSANLRTAVQEQTLHEACFGALSGTLGVGSPCADSIECTPGEFCDPVDGGATVCQPLRTAGQSCGDFGPNGFVQSETACSYRGSGNTGLSCRYGVFPNVFDDAGAWTCGGALSAGNNCFTGQDCLSLLCNPDESFVCVNAETLITPSGCSQFIVAAPPDAGADSGH